MSKRKLNLNNLLAKYDGYSSTTNLQSFYRQPNQSQKLKTHAQDDFNQHRTYHQSIMKPNIQRQQVIISRGIQINGHFNMSKSQVEQFLLAIKDQLRQQYGQIPKIKDHAIRDCLDKFERNHEKIRQYVLSLMEKAFHQNKKAIQAQFDRIAKSDISEFNTVYKKITSIQEQVNRLLNALKGSQYKKAIAQVVMRDFNTEINELRSNLRFASKSYVQNLGQIQSDSNKIEGINGMIQKIFYFSRKGKQSNQIKVQQQEGFFSIFKDKTQIQNNMDPNQSRTRKSFFNFNF